MKKIVLAVLAVILLGMFAEKVSADSYWYSTTVGTIAVTDASSLAPSINYASCKLQSVGVWHMTASTCTYKMYDHADSTTTATLIGTITLPATIGFYPVFGNSVLTSGFTTGSDLISAPYFYIRKDDVSTYCPYDGVQAIYKK